MIRFTSVALAFFLCSFVLLRPSFSSPSERWREVKVEKGHGEVEEGPGGANEGGQRGINEEGTWGYMPNVERAKHQLLNLINSTDDELGTRGDDNQQEHQEDEEQDQEEEEEDALVIIRVEDEEVGEGAFLASLLYHPPSPWGPCTRSCLVRRIRVCKFQTICGDQQLLLEQAYCYTAHSNCRNKVLTHLRNEGYFIINDPEEQQEEEQQEEEDKLWTYEEEDEENDNKVNENEENENKEDNEENVMNGENENEESDGNEEDVENDVNGAENDVNGAENDVNGAENDVNGIENDVNGIENDVNGIENDVNGIEIEDNDLNEEIHQHEDEEDLYFTTERSNQTASEGNEEEATVKTTEAEEEQEEEEEEEEEEECGRRSYRTTGWLRIIGGTESMEGEWPWQVAILNRFGNFFCGGTLVAPRWVVTAAHCVRRKLYVKLGLHNVRQRTEGSRGVKMTVEESFKHPDYEASIYIEHDIALLRLPRAVNYSSVVQRACLPSQNAPAPLLRTRCVVSGWGKEREAHTTGTKFLMFTEVPIVGKYACDRAYPDHPITENHICAGYISGRYDTCKGDSGGPMVCKGQNGRWVLEGVTSFGGGCGERARFGVYTRVSKYREWMREVMALYD